MVESGALLDTALAELNPVSSIRPFSKFILQKNPRFYPLRNQRASAQLLQKFREMGRAFGGCAQDSGPLNRRRMNASEEMRFLCVRRGAISGRAVKGE